MSYGSDLLGNLTYFRSGTPVIMSNMILFILHKSAKDTAIAGLNPRSVNNTTLPLSVSPRPAGDIGMKFSTDNKGTSMNDVINANSIFSALAIK